MKFRVSQIFMALFLGITALCAPAAADEQLADPAVASTETPQNTIEHIDVSVEGTTVSVRLQRKEDGVLIEAGPIFTQLQGEAKIEDAVLTYFRKQDGAEMSLDFIDGKVRGNGLVLGKLPEWETAETASLWLTPNAIAVLTGTLVEETVLGSMSFALDERLKPKFDLDLWVSGQKVDPGTVRPQTIGPVLLIPLRPVATALGHTISQESGSSLVTITRIQDSAILTLDMATGLVSVNNTPRGVSPNMSFADNDQLLLPFTAVETLTGTHITLTPGDSRVVIELDERLDGGALPGERVVDEAEATPLTAERLDFEVSDRGQSRAALRGRYKDYNLQLRYETIGRIYKPEEIQPALLSLDVQALDGWRATIGDVNSSSRELTPVDTSRIRGASFKKRLESGTIMAIAAGIPVTGTEAVTDRASKPVFGGAAAGVRLIKPRERFEYGIAMQVDDATDSNRLVAGAQKEFQFEEKDTGIVAAFAQADIGAFNDQDGTSIDFRGRAEMRYKLSNTSGVHATISHDGSKFLNNQPQLGIDKHGNFAGVFRDNIDSRTAGSLSLDWRGTENWNIIHFPAGSVRLNTVHQGDTTSTNVSASGSGRIGENGIDFSVDISKGITQSAEKETTHETLSIRAYKREEWGTMQASYTAANDSEQGTSQRLVANVNAFPIQRDLGEGASVSLGPSASAVWTPNTSFLRIGATASASSGQKFGERFHVNGQLSALQSVDPESSSTTLFAGVQARYKITDRIELSGSYSDDFNTRRDFRIGLRGSVLFNEPRKYVRPLEGRGVLKGRVFFDKNRDGVRQEDERGIPNVQVRVRGTRLALNVDNEGRYTIQNINTGLWGLMIDRRTLPLGMLVSETYDPKATIGEGRVTNVDIPVIASGQLRGAIFDDTNTNGTLDSDETRMEGVHLTLTRVDDPDDIQKSRSASFGQYGFENLYPGEYILTAMSGPKTRKVAVRVTEESLFQVQQVGLLPEGHTLLESTAIESDTEQAEIEFTP